jgi:hypothetical protein
MGQPGSECPLPSPQTGEYSLPRPFGAIFATLGISHRLTTAYHPQANGMVERFHRQFKDALRARLVNQDWLSQLPWVLLGLRAAPKEDCGLSSSEMVFGEPLVLTGQFLSSSPPAPGFLEQLRQSMEPQVARLRTCALSWCPAAGSPPGLLPGENALKNLRPKLQNQP